MKIKVDNFLIEVDSTQGYNLTKMSTVKGGKRAGEDIKEIVSHNVSLAHCCRKIVKTNLADQNLIVSLDEFLNLYRKEVDRITHFVGELNI